MILRLTITLVGLVLISSNTAAREGDNSFVISLSTRQLSFDVYDEGGSSPAGTLTNDILLLPDFGFETGARYFADSSWGYRLVMNLGYFNMDTQEVGSRDDDLGTSASGYYLYAMPVAFHDFLAHRDGQSLRAGLGLGLGYLNASGDIILSENPGQPKLKFNLADLTPAFGLFVEYERGPWSYQASIYGPEVIKDDLEFNLFDMGLSIRRRLYF